jgi:hypothetical protein
MELTGKQSGGSMHPASNDTDDDHNSPPELTTQQFLPSAGNKRELRWDELEEHPRFRRVLLFAGLVRPPSWWSPWWLCYIGWPLTVLFELSINWFFVVVDRRQGEFYSVDIPVTFGKTISFSCYWWLVPKVRELIMEDVPLREEQAASLVLMSTAFMVTWLLIGFVQWVCDMVVQPSLGIVFNAFNYTYVEWIDASATTPILGAVLLVLGIEVTHATNDIKELLQMTRDQTLTREVYVASRNRIRDRSDSWKYSLGLLAIAAFANTVGLITILHSPQVDPYYDDSPKSRAAVDIYHLIVSGKDVTMLFVIMALVMQVNDHAGSVNTVLNNERWGDPGSIEDTTRLDLINLTTAHSIEAGAAASIKQYLTTSRSRPIAFQVIFVRPDRNLFAAAVVSLFGSLVGSLLNSYL